jgi:hypothetical protein
MAHAHHQHAHLVRRQQNRDEDAGSDEVATVVSVRYVTAKNTYTVPVKFITPSAPAPQASGPARLGSALEIPRPSSAIGVPNRQISSTQAPSSRQPSATPSSQSDDDGVKPPSSSVDVQSSLIMATRAPTVPVGSFGAAIATASASVTAIASAPPAEGEMSTGAKAGLALGILILVGALLTGILLLYRRKKKQQMAASQDNEKIGLNDAPHPLPPQVQAAAARVPVHESAPSISTQRTMSTAPRLSLRPVTQFDPAFENQNQKSAGNLLTVAAAAGPATLSKERDLPDRPRSAWERPGAANVAPAENPFNDPQSSSPPSANPFGNDHALPNSPPNASPLLSTQPSSDFANPAAAIASADVTPVAAATTVASVSPAAPNFPAPPGIHALSDSVPASPAWTEDFPASPGPAPAGPPPVAGLAVAARPNSPSAPVDNVHRVQLDFKPSMQDELGLHAGQLVRMLHEYDDGWVSTFLTELMHCQTLIISRLSASVWIVLSKALFPVPACQSILSSLAAVHRVKAHHPQVCAVLPYASPWALPVFLSLVRSRLPAVVTRLTRPACLLAPIP